MFVNTITQYSSISRYRNINKGKRSKLNKLHLTDIKNSAEPLFEMSSIADAHCLMELSQTEWKRYKDSSIHASGRVENKNRVVSIYYTMLLMSGNKYVRLRENQRVMEKQFGGKKLIF